MKIPDIDKRTKQDILEKLHSLSESYTPEWRFDLENPDVGSALAIIYGEMFSKTIRLFNQSAEKNQLSFFNHLGTKIQPSVPAYGYLTFFLAPQVEHGVEIPRGTQAVAEGTDDQEQDLIYETVNDLYVTPAQVETIYETDGKTDVICCCYERENFLQKPAPFYLFEAFGQNLQSHFLYFCHDTVLKLSRRAVIELDFGSQLKDPTMLELYRSMLDSSCIQFSYYTEQGWEPILQTTGPQKEILLMRPDGALPFAEGTFFEQTGYWIRCQAKEIFALENMSIDKITLRSSAEELLPDVVHASGTDQNLMEYLPFGERMGLYDMVYFGCEEVLCKAGAQIQLKFNMDFLKFPVEIDPKQPEINWKMVMKKSDFRPNLEYDITIEEVIWEYYNGQGWSRLFADNRYSDIFTTKYGTIGQLKIMDFVCPMDMQKIVINSHDTFFIRARVLKINNLYKTKGNFISPLLSETSFSYSYPSQGLMPLRVAWENQMEQHHVAGYQLERWAAPLRPFQRIENEEKTVYLGFEFPPKGAPIKLFLQMKNTLLGVSPKLRWEYWGPKGWKEVNLVDETQGLTKSGIVTMIGAEDFQRRTYFGKNLYWMRIIDVANVYRQANLYPCINQMFMNTTRILNIRTREEERFFIQPHEENKKYQLPDRHLYQVEVWVCETGQIEDEELALLEQENRVEKQRNETGMVADIWVRWEETEDFILGSPSSRWYQVDRNEGTISFSDGKYGKIPTSQPYQSILVRYSTSGGQAGNQETGKVNRLNQNIAYINGVSNPEPTVGGSNPETAAEAMARMAAFFSHRARAVTASDYENLAREASRAVYKVKCFSGLDGFGKRMPGAVTLVLLQKDYFGGRKYFDMVQQQVMAYLKDKVSRQLLETGKLFIAEPQFLEICVKAEILVDSFDRIFQVKGDAEQRLSAFIDPIYGNFDGNGWSIGVLPNVTQLTNVLKSVPNIKQIKSVSLSVYLLESGKRAEINLEHQELYKFALPVSGQHNLYLTVG